MYLLVVVTVLMDVTVFDFLLGAFTHFNNFHFKVQCHASHWMIGVDCHIIAFYVSHANLALGAAFTLGNERHAWLN